MTTLPSLEKRKRLPTLIRAPKEALPGFRLTPRDVEIMQAVHDYRALTAPQIEALFFLHSNENAGVNARCKLRLRILYHHGYLFRDEQPTKLSEGRKPLVYFLDRMGALYLSQLEGREVNWKPQDNDITYPFLQHVLATNDFRVAVTRSARNHSFEIPVWLDDRTLKSRQMKDTITLKGENGGRERAAVVPDSYFRLETHEDRFHFFVECDLGTVTLDATGSGKRDWMRKVKAYLEYYRSGLYEKRYQTKDMRVLTVTRSEKRMRNLKDVTEEAGGKSRFWFTTFDAIREADVLTSPVWAIASRDERLSLL